MASDSDEEPAQRASRLLGKCRRINSESDPELIAKRRRLAQGGAGPSTATPAIARHIAEDDNFIDDTDAEFVADMRENPRPQHPYINFEAAEASDNEN